ncbi:MAG TPA: PAM68 family protein [Prochlorococcaceae cyanobacterium AMR_MDS_5431]|nr:PAM68 family protein [Prochlorococcaceae cyanobacterium AMR_MDS_5431]
MAKPNSLFKTQVRKTKSANQLNNNDTNLKPTYKAIPTTIADRMARRIALTTGIPAMLGISVFISNYILVSRQIVKIPPGLTLLMSGLCFLLSLIGLSYGIISTSWGKVPGTTLGFEQVLINVNRLRGKE